MYLAPLHKEQNDIVELIRIPIEHHYARLLRFTMSVRDSPFALPLLNHMTQLVRPSLETVEKGNWSGCLTLGFCGQRDENSDVPTRKIAMGVVLRPSLAQPTASRVSFLCGTSLCFLLHCV